MPQKTFWHNEIRCSCSCYDILFCCNVAAVVRSRQLHEYKSNNPIALPKGSKKNSCEGTKNLRDSAIRVYA